MGTFSLPIWRQDKKPSFPRFSISLAIAVSARQLQTVLHFWNLHQLGG
jgi:hypothetical protein